ncbi:hypothetical protein GCM10018793_18600 [Streptomyces sulfonofaciens]|uniref:Uncharacterized protein n=1 Tax=Streptomyces sulfonofaciens TaxID=68272 RepID=A0A919FZQ4_9ACTN|nr:hypothetical protein GCM10018793_18600 [Streptomyces sulfonofaciens]
MVGAVNTRPHWPDLLGEWPACRGVGRGGETAGQKTDAGSGYSGPGVRAGQGLDAGEGVCAQYAPEVPGLGIGGPAEAEGRGERGAARRCGNPGRRCPCRFRLPRDVGDSARERPGECIHARCISDKVEIHGPNGRDAE